MRPLKLLFAIKGMDLARGGAERVLAQITAGLIERGHEVSLVSFDMPGGHSFYPLHKRLRRIPLGIGHTDRSATLAETLRRLPALRRVVRAECADVVVGFMHSMFVPLAAAMLGTGVPLVASEHNVPERYADRRAQYLLLMAASLRAAGTTVLSPAVRCLFPRFLRRRMIAVANPITMPRGLRAKPEGVDGSPKTLLAIGRLVAQKNQETLIRAYGVIADEYPDWRLRIVGEGELREDLEQTVRELDLQGRIELAGAVTDVDRQYREAQLVVVPSRYESFGLVTGEALSFGLPVIGFADCPGTNELIVDGVNGILVAPGDRVANLAAAMSSLMADGSKRVALGARGPDSIVRYRQDVIVDQWEQILGDVARRPLQDARRDRIAE